MTNETNSIKETRKIKSKPAETQTLESFFTIYQAKGQEPVLYLWAKVRREWMSCGAFYPKVGWGFKSIFLGGKRQSSVLQLQYKLGGQPIYLRTETGGGKSQRTIQIETKKC